MSSARRALILAVLFAVAGLTFSGCAKAILNKGFPQLEGEIPGLQLSAPVEILRDGNGIPSIFAQNIEDLMTAQGFLHAQDRLWQMEFYRRLITGTLSEVVGEGGLAIDYLSRSFDFAGLRKKLADNAGDEEKKLIAAYVRGVNLQVESREGDLPLEFKSLEVSFAPFTELDVFNVLVANAWFLETNLRQELLVLAAKEKLDRNALADILPSSPGATLPEDAYYDALRDVKVGPIEPMILALFGAPAERKDVGSNNWVAAESVDGKPLLANDPHLSLLVPSIWYFMHLSCPEYHAAGATMAGAPGIVIGHNDRIAWGLTNVMTDIVDLIVLKTDPANPYVYYLGEQAHTMSRADEVFKLPDGTSRTIPIYRTVHGPVITQVAGRVDAVVSLKWYATTGLDLKDRTMAGMIALNRAHSVKEAFDAGRNFRAIGQNLLVADVDGNIGWHATGAVPERRGYSGRLPADGTGTGADWTGFLPYEQMPSLYNPEAGFIATANQRSTPDDAKNPISFGWCSPYRYERITERLEKMSVPTFEQFAALHADVYAKQADNMIPKLLRYKFDDAKAAQALSILEGWDREMTRESVGSSVFNVFITQFVRELLADELGDALGAYYRIFTIAYLAQDVIFDRPQSPLWDDVATEGIETHEAIVKRSLVATIDWLTQNMGPDQAEWQWGKLHQYHWAHPGAEKPIEHKLLSRGPYPAPGGNATVNVASFVPVNDSYSVQVIPSLRMIAPLSDLSKTKIVGPMGQSGQPGHEHYDDMNDKWMNVEYLPLPFTRDAAEGSAKHKLTLLP
jgi:penicillin G amidase